ncbi:MAG TPA: alpha/beta hydrolase, partial [Terriglobales bacterium]|nr:alpha/beta hydrolase [Terriglobales bacterium]
AKFKGVSKQRRTIMAEHIQGPLYYERMGRTGPVIAFIHPNPMDQSCWIFQMAHFSTWYRCVAIDIPGYGRSPKAKAGLTMDDMSQACWEVIDDAAPGERAILVGCSVGSSIAPCMYHLRPDKTSALVLSGTGYNPSKEFTKGRIENYTTQGVDYRWAYTFEDMSATFRTTPLAHYFADLFSERNDHADVETIIHQFKALAQPYPEGHFERIACPTIILTGSEDNSHQRAFALQKIIPNCELKTLPGAGHACQLEQPWLFDRFMIEFLAKHGLFPGSAKKSRRVV